MIRKLVLSLFGRKLTSYLRDVAEGKEGTKKQDAYLALKGWKTYTGLALGVIGALCYYFGFVEWSIYSGVFATPLVSMGFLDKGWNTEPPAFVRDSTLFKLIHENSHDVALILGGIAASLQTCSPSLVASLARLPGSPTCDTMTIILGAFSALLVWMGLGAAALKAEPPAIQG